MLRACKGKVWGGGGGVGGAFSNPGCVQITPGHWDCLRVNCGQVSANMVR